MIRKTIIFAGAFLLVAALLLGPGAARGQDGDDAPPALTTASGAVGVGSYVAAEAYGIAAGEDAEAQPAQAIILPASVRGVAAPTDYVQLESAAPDFTFAWELAAPEGSAAELMPGNVAIFQADVEGVYTLTLTATDPAGNTATTTWTVAASTYIGVGGMSPDAPAFPQCGTCHADHGPLWYNTAHGTAFSRALDGEGLDPATNLPRITTGYQPGADNGGFDDLAGDWMPPTELVPGNWAAVSVDQPHVAQMSSVQCEACHGPGSLHVTQGIANPDMPLIDEGLAAGVCANCHTVADQWDLSAHADKTAQAFWYPTGEDHQDCVKCHSGVGFIDAAAGLPQRTDYQPVTCAVCHDPHGSDNPGQLRVFDAVLLPDGTDITTAGASATCMSCHNTRRDPVTSVQAAVEGGSLSTPHYSNAAELLNNTGGYTWDETLPASLHGVVIQGSCVTCHMADAADNTVGGHTFAMTAADGTPNTTQCAMCHGPTEGFDLPARGDYDGNGAIETTAAELAGLRAVLQAALEAEGVVVLDHYPYFEIPDGASEALYGAVYNLQFAHSDTSAVHNFKYTAALLQLSYEKLTGAPIDGADVVQ